MRLRMHSAALDINFIAVCESLAKRLEEVWLPGDPDPVILPRRRQRACTLLQRVRDEALVCRRLSPATTRESGAEPASSMIFLDLDPPGGRHCSNTLVRCERCAGVEEIAAVPGVGPKLAATILDAVAKWSEWRHQRQTGELLGNALE